MTPIEALLGFYGPSLVREGSRWVRLQGLVLSLQSLREARRAALVIFFAFLASMLLTASVFSLLLHELWSFEVSGRFSFDLFFWVCGALGLLSLASIAWNLSEKRWLAMSGLEVRIREAHGGDYRSKTAA